MSEIWYYLIVFSAGIAGMILGAAFQEWWVVAMAAVACVGSGVMIYLWVND